MVEVTKPILSDLDRIKEILNQWTQEEETNKYLQRIRDEIGGKTEFNQRFWVAKEDDQALGVTGLSDPLPKVIPFSKTEKPGEGKILYLDKLYRGKGIGKMLMEFIEVEARRQGYTELMLRSAERYRDTAYGFYEHAGYKKRGTVTSEDPSKTMQVFGKVL